MCNSRLYNTILDIAGIGELSKTHTIERLTQSFQNSAIKNGLIKYHVEDDSRCVEYRGILFLVSPSLHKVSAIY